MHLWWSYISYERLLLFKQLLTPHSSRSVPNSMYDLSCVKFIDGPAVVCRHHVETVQISIRRFFSTLFMYDLTLLITDCVVLLKSAMVLTY